VKSRCYKCKISSALLAATIAVEQEVTVKFRFLYLHASDIHPAPDLDGGEPGAQAWWEAPCADTKCLGRG